MTVTEWADRGSYDEPWEINYLLLVDRNETRDLRVGWNPQSQCFQMVQVFVTGSAVAEDFESASECMAAVEGLLGERPPSWFEWQIVNDRDAGPRPRRVWTRGHEAPGGTRVAA